MGLEEATGPNVVDTSEQTHLFAYLFRVDGQLAHGTLHLPNRRRRMPGKVVAHISEDLEVAFGQLAHDATPVLDLSAAIHLNPGEINDGAIRPHPPDIDEVGGR